MHYAEFAEDEVCSKPFPRSDVVDLTDQSVALRDAIRDYEANKWKVIGQKVGKPAKVWRSLVVQWQWDHLLMQH